MIEYVVKRDGSTEKFDPVKLNKWAEYATAVGGNWSEIAQKTFKRLQNYCKTTDIHDTMVSVCLAKQSLEYSRVASRLEFAEIRKGMQYKLGFDDRKDFKTIYAKLIEIGVWDKNSLPEYSEKIEQIYAEIITVRLDYWQVKQWVEKYAVKVDGVVVETPHIGYMGLALALFGGTDEAREYAMCLAQGKINLPTPALNGLRNGDWDTISCCVISAGDNVESIGAANYLAYRMTAKKAGIGIEYTTRSKGDSVKQGRIEHLGKHPILKTLDREVKCMCYDTETEVLTNSGFKFFKDLTDEDLVAQVNHDRTLEFVKPTEYVALQYSGEMYHFSKRGVDIRVTGNHQMANRTVKYDDKSQATSDGYIFQRADEFEPKRTVAWDFGGNLNGDYTTLSQMDRLRIAYQSDGTLRENETTSDSYSFSFKKERKTKRFEEIIESLGIPIHVSKTKEPGCSMYYVETACGMYTKFLLKKPSFVLEKNLDWVYDRNWSDAAGREFFEELSNWDGDFTRKGNQLCCFNTNEKTVADAVQYVAAVCNKRSTLALYDGTYRVYVYDQDCSTGESTNVEVTNYDGIVYCVTVPSHILVVRRNGVTNVCGNTQITRGGNATATILCIDPEIENLILVKSQRIDIEQRIDKLDYEFGYNDAFLQAVIKDEPWYLFSLVDAHKLYDLFYTAFATEYNQEVNLLLSNGVKHKKIQARELLGLFLTVRQETGRYYDNNLTRTNQHTPFIDVIRQSNLCEEVALPTKPYVSMQDLFTAKSEGETAFCSLSAVNVAKVEQSEKERVAYLALKAVDKMIDKAPMLTESMKESIMRRRSVGIGITGLASLLYSKGLDYVDTPETLDFVQKIAEEHYFYLLKASQKMAQDDNYCVDGVNLNWLPIDTAMNKSIAGLDWEALRGKPRKHSVLAAHMPTESSSLLSGSSNGLYPVRRKIINKRSRKGLVQFICKEFVEGQTIPAWEVDTITLSKIYARVQDFTDQAISCDFYVSPNRNGGKLSMAQMMKEWVAHAKLGNKTKYYLNTDDYNGGSFQDILEKEPEEEEACESCKL